MFSATRSGTECSWSASSVCRRSWTTRLGCGTCLTTRTLLARSISPTIPLVMLEAVKLMAAVCLVPPDGHDKVGQHLILVILAILRVIWNWKLKISFLQINQLFQVDIIHIEILRSQTLKPQKSNECFICKLRSTPFILHPPTLTCPIVPVSHLIYCH